MRVMAIVKGENPDGGLPPIELFDAMGRFNERLAEAGVMVDGGGLLPSKDGKRLAYEDGDTRVIDGPFAETKELVSGFWILNVESLDEAIDWMRQAPFGGGFQLELRPIGGDDAFNDIFTEDMIARQERIRELIGRNVQKVYA
jgi:hypothetical protein